MCFAGRAAKRRDHLAVARSASRARDDLAFAGQEGTVGAGLFRRSDAALSHFGMRGRQNLSPSSRPGSVIPPTRASWFQRTDSRGHVVGNDVGGGTAGVRGGEGDDDLAFSSMRTPRTMPISSTVKYGSSGSCTERTCVHARVIRSALVTS